MHLDDRLDTPLYQQLFDQLRHRIEEGDQPEGSRLPPIWAAPATPWRTPTRCSPRRAT